MTGDPSAPDTYALRAPEVAEVPAPELAWRPPAPKRYRPRIALIGAGGIAAAHLDAYRTAGWEVAAICGRTLPKAQARAEAFFPEARVTDDLAALLADPSIDVLDVTPHPADRLPILEAALEAGKHVLSQKPFVLDLDTGERLAALARARGVKLAVNQNGRWAPHLAYIREAVRAGLVGDVFGIHANVHWDHGWIAGTPFEEVANLVLYDFGIHWFDFVTSVAGSRVEAVTASCGFARGQTARMPLLAQALVRLEGGQASLIFDGATRFGPRDTTYVGGTLGALQSDGPDLGTQSVTLTTAAGRARPTLEGEWFNDGFRGAMGELLCAIEDDREPQNSAAENLTSLALTFAAVASAVNGGEVRVGDARALTT